MSQRACSSLWRRSGRVSRSPPPNSSWTETPWCHLAVSAGCMGQPASRPKPVMRMSGRCKKARLRASVNTSIRWQLPRRAAHEPAAASTIQRRERIQKLRDSGLMKYLGPRARSAYPTMKFHRLLHRNYWDRERALELESHLRHEIDDNVARGMTLEEARRQA